MDFQQGKIYKIVEESTKRIIYVGSTCHTLDHRFDQHIRAKTTGQSEYRPLYEYMRESDIEDIEIYLLEDYPCETQTELWKREAYWIDHVQPPFNKKSPYRTPEELAENKKAANKRYRDSHKEEISDSKKEWYAVHGEEVNARRRLEYEDKKEDIAKMQKESYRRTGGQRVPCPHCAKEYCKVYLKKHIKTCIPRAVINFED